jgi:hypothetical protein
MTKKLKTVTKYQIVDEAGHVLVKNYDSKDRAQRNATRLSKKHGHRFRVESYKAPAGRTVVMVVPRGRR